VCRASSGPDVVNGQVAVPAVGAPGNSLMDDLGVDQGLRMREVGHFDKAAKSPLHDPLIEASSTNGSTRTPKGPVAQGVQVTVV
jgi:hypothetical protein